MVDNSILRYELVDVEWILEYDFCNQDASIASEDIAIQQEDNAYETDKDGIPMGQSIEEIRIRQSIISKFYYNWKINHPEKRIFNLSLNEFINVRQVSIEEAKEHSSKSYKSTLAFIKIDEVLAKAIKETTVMPKPGNKNQSKFEKLILMSHKIEGIGTIKLTVGILRSNKDKVQYGLTALKPDQTIKEEKKKASQK